MSQSPFDLAEAQRRAVRASDKRGTKMLGTKVSRGITLDSVVASIETSRENGRSLEIVFDCQATIDELQAAIDSLREGNGGQATQLCADAFARLALFHRL
jgi:hypothetical protein